MFGPDLWKRAVTADEAGKLKLSERARAKAAEFAKQGNSHEAGRYSEAAQAALSCAY